MLTGQVFSAPVLGSSPKNPILFSHLEQWLKDPRKSLDLFEETLQTDLLAFRFDYTTRLTPTYMRMEDPISPGGRLSSTSVEHITFQGMFWGPLFTTAMWEVPMFTADLVMALLSGTWLGLTKLPVQALKYSWEAAGQMSQEEVSFSSLFRINVLFTSDVLMFEFEEISGGYYFKKGKSLIGRSYAGMSFRLLESNYFFAGFQFVHLPPVEGLTSFLASDPEYSNANLIPRYFVTSQSDSPSTSVDNLLYYTRVQMFLYNNFLDFFQIRTLINFDTEYALDLLGLGFILDFWENLDLSTYFNYLRNLDKYTFDFNGALALTKKTALIYDYQMSLAPFDALEYLKLGLDINFKIAESDGQDFTFNLNGAAVTYKRNGVQELGFKAEMGLVTPLSGRIVLGTSYNLDETMPLLPFTEDAWMLYLHLEIGMNNDFGSLLRNVFGEEW